MSQTVKLRRSASSGSVPTTSQLALGELAINTYDGKLYLKKNVSGTESIVEIGANNLADTFHVYEYSVTTNTTVFQGSDDNSHTLSYTTGSPPRIAVYLNGLLLDWGTDFTATNGTSVTLTSAAVSGDLVQIQAYKSTVVAGSNLMFGDGVKAQFGDDGDLEIYHDGTRSIINDVGTGNLQFQVGGTAIYDVTTDGIVLADGLDVEANEFIGDLRGAILFKAQAGEALAKGDVVYISGINGNTTIVSKADANDASKMPAFGVASTAISSGTTGDIYTFGTLSGLDTSSFTLGDELYVSTTAGALTNSAPTGSSSQIQKIAKVTRSDNSAGSIKIMGAGRSNATPNLDEGKIFVGNSSNQSVQVDSTITVDMANSQVLVDGALSVEGGSFASGLETATDAGLVIQKGDYIYSDDDDYLRKIIGHTAANHIEIGQNNTALIGDINIRPGSTGNIKLFGSGSEDFKVDSSGNTTMNGTATINNAVTGDASQFTILNGAGATLRMGITGSGSNEAAHIKTNAGEALEFHIGQASNATTPDIEFLADGAGIDFQGVNILNSSRNMTTNSSLTFDYNDHYLEAGTNSLALKNSSGTSYFVASNTGLSVTGALSSTGNLTVGGNLTVNGTTTTLNTATLSVDDLNITIADGAANAAAANGAGITVDGANATLTYTSADDEWNFNKNLVVGGKETTASFPLMVKSDTAHQGIHIEENSGAESFQIGVDASGDLNFYNSGSTTPMLKLNDGNNLVLGHTSYTAQHSQNIGGNTDRLMAVTSNTAGQTVGYHLGINDGSRNSRVKLFMTDDATAGNRAFGIHQTWSSGGGAPFVIAMGTSERFRINTSGNVGIGTNAPTGTLQLGDASSSVDIVLHGPNNTAVSSAIYFGDHNTDDAPGYYGISLKHNTDANRLDIVNENETEATSGELMSIMRSSGHVGIGTTSPSSRLNIVHSGNDTNGIIVQNASAGTGARSNMRLLSDAGQLDIYATGSNYSGVASWPDAGVLSTSSNTSGGLILNTQAGGIKFQYGTTERMRVHTNGNIGINETTPLAKLEVAGSIKATSKDTSHTSEAGVTLSYDTSNNIALLETWTSKPLLTRTYNYQAFDISGTEMMKINSTGVGISNSDPKAKFQVEEYGIDTTETSTSATTQTVIHSMSATDFRSARFTIQVTNSTDSTYHTTEILMVHDGTTANITEFGKVYTANEEATFDADVSSGNVRLFATPATSDSMEFKVVCHSITV